MYSTDPIADMLTRIRNALMRGRKRVEIPHSRIKEQVLEIFLQYRFVAGLKTVGAGKQKILIVELVDEEMPISPISDLKRLSRPGRRVYVGWRLIPRIKSGRGLVVLSTNRGLMSGPAARKANLGGEVIFSVY